MKVFWTLVWSFVLAHMMNYVAGSINGGDYSFMVGNYLTIAFAAIVFIVSFILPKDEGSESH